MTFRSFRSVPSSTILRWTAFAAVLSISAPAIAIALHQDLYLHRHLFLLGLAWVAAVSVLLAALGVHRRRLTEEIQRADEELSGVKRRFAALAAGLGNDFFLYEHDAAGVFIYLSPSVPAILGWSAAEFKAHYTTFLTDHPVNRDVVVKTEGSLAGVQQEPYPVEVRHKDGSRRWLEVYEVPVKDPHGRVASVLGIARDCTENRRAQRELQYVRAAVDQALDALCIARLDGTVRFANKAWGRLHGYEPADLVGKNLAMFHTPEQMERDVRPFNEAVMRDSSHSGEVEHVHRDGTPVPTWMRTVLFTDPDGRPEGLVGLARDLRESRQRDSLMRELLDSLDELVFAASPAGKLGFINAAFRAAVGGPAVHGADAVNCVAPDSRPLWEEAFSRVLRGEAPPPLRLSLAGRAGLTVPVEVQMRLIRPASDAPEVRCLARDLRLSEALVAQTARASLLRSLGVLAGGVAHDFNNLLTVIIGRISLALDDASLAPDVRHMLDGAQISAHRASELSRQLLTLSKGGVCELRPIDLRKLVLETTEFALSGSTVVLEAAVADDLWPVNGDRLQLSQVVANVVLNAKQAMARGGTLRITARNVALDSGRHVFVEFADTGPGIPPETLKRIFEPYFTTKEDGSGLGLAVSSAIVERHAGRMEAVSEEGRGAAFRLYLRASARAAEADVLPPEPVRGSGRILVMDDEPDVLSTASMILERAGFSVVQARHGEQALELAGESRRAGRPVSAAVLDLNVKGGLGGCEIYERLRRSEPGLPVVASTGFMTPGLERDLLQQGFSALLPKPYTGRTLAKLVIGILKDAATP